MCSVDVVDRPVTTCGYTDEEDASLDHSVATSIWISSTNIVISIIRRRVDRGEFCFSESGHQGIITTSTHGIETGR